MLFKYCAFLQGVTTPRTFLAYLPLPISVIVPGFLSLDIDHHTQQFTPSVKLKMRPKHVVLPPIEQSYNTSATSQLLSLNSVQIAAVPVSIRVAALQ